MGPRIVLRVYFCLASVAVTKRTYMMCKRLDKQNRPKVVDCSLWSLLLLLPLPFPRRPSVKDSMVQYSAGLGNAGKLALGVQMRLMGGAERGDADSAGLVVFVGIEHESWEFIRVYSEVRIKKEKSKREIYSL